MNYTEEDATLKVTCDLIKRAVHGNQKALEKILRIYDPYINSVVTVKVVEGRLQANWNAHSVFHP